MRNSSATPIHEAKMAVPPTNGVQLKIAAMVAPGAIEDAAFTCRCSATMPGSLDHGPVQATTMAIRTRIGRPPDCEKRQQTGEANNGPDHVGQIWPEINRGRQLAGDVAE